MVACRWLKLLELLEVANPFEIFSFSDVGDLKLMAMFGCWLHLFNVNARRCKKMVDVDDQND